MDLQTSTVAVILCSFHRTRQSERSTRLNPALGYTVDWSRCSTQSQPLGMGIWESGRRRSVTQIWWPVSLSRLMVTLQARWVLDFEGGQLRC